MQSICLLAALLLSDAPAPPHADVIVYGSTPGGFCAAIAAAREGASVILLEPTDHIGGMNTGGLSHCDSNQMVRSTLMGLFHEWHTRVVQDYTQRGLKMPYDPKLKNQERWTFEPHVAMRVTRRMLKESGVTVRTGQYLKAVKKDGPRILSLATGKGEFHAKVFVDGTYEGDLMAAADVEWTIGREGRAEFGEKLAGKRYPKKTMNISGFDETGRLLPLVTTSDAGPDEAGDKNLMTYSFRLCLTKDPANLVPMPKPANYDPARFELARRALKVGAQVGFDSYPLPGKKFDGNNAIGAQISLGLIGGGNHWHSADEAGRQKIWEDHKQYTLEFIHFLRTDPAVPKSTRDKFAQLGLCKDEFADTDHFPPALYVRESRRMKGMYVISQKDIVDSPEAADPIAISSFPIDSHDCQRVALKDGGVINEGTIFPVRAKGSGAGYAYHVPYRCVLPKPNQCANLLVPVALSCTHVGMSSLRIEGAWMVIGQGAGIAAALAAKQGVAVQDVPYPVLRERLLAQGQVLDLPRESKTATAPRAGSFHVESRSADPSTDALGSGRFQWTTTEPLVSPVRRPDDPCYSIKDPSIVRFENRWHLFCTIRSQQRTHQIEYLAFDDWKDANTAPRHILSVANGYFCAPQVFFFEPQRKWYLLYQALDKARKVALQPVFSTTTNIADPQSWTAPSFLYPAHPENVEGWIDFWVICDEAKAHLFFTSNNGKMWRAETKLAAFPNGWSKPEVVLRGDIFEASHTYRLKGRTDFLTVIEAVGPGGRRYYQAYLADKLDGQWRPLAATAEQPFASPLNVRSAGEPWADSYSHGELLRAGYDQTMQIDPANLEFLFQGVSDRRRAGKKYGEIPWQLGLLRPVL